MKALLTICFLVLCQYARAQYVYIPLERKWPRISLVAIVNVGEVSKVSTPQGVMVQSATAKIEKLIYRASPPFEGSPEDEVILYSFMPNGLEAACPAPLQLESGRAFVMMAQNGMNKFFPSDPWEFQPLSRGDLLWPTGDGVKQMPVEDVIALISAHAAQHPQKD